MCLQTKKMWPREKFCIHLMSTSSLFRCQGWRPRGQFTLNLTQPYFCVNLKYLKYPPNCLVTKFFFFIRQICAKISNKIK
jgi:hypothetical protein